METLITYFNLSVAISKLEYILDIITRTKEIYALFHTYRDGSKDTKNQSMQYFLFSMLMYCSPKIIRNLISSFFFQWRISDNGAPKKKLRAPQPHSVRRSCDLNKCLIWLKSDDICELPAKKMPEHVSLKHQKWGGT